MTKVKKSILFLSLALLALAFFGCERQAQKVTIDSRAFNLTVADTASERAKGLSDIKALNISEGMLFVFDQKENLDFWMKDTLIPLQIIFIDGCKVVDVQEMSVESDLANPASHYISQLPADKAIELNSKSIKNNIIGEEIKELCQ